MGAFSAYVAYSQVDDDGHAQDSIIITDPIFTANEISSNEYFRSEKAYAIDVNYKINANAKIGGRFSNLSFDTGVAVDRDIMAYYGSYAFDGALKGFEVEATYETVNYDTGSDTNELRFKANYKF